MMKLAYKLLLLSGIIWLTACNNDTQKTNTVEEEKPRLKIPSFDKDSAYYFVEKQLSFGTRVPGSEGHQACKNWLVQKFKEFGAEVIEQDFVANVYTGESLNSTNIIAQYNVEAKKRILLSAHWDSRFIAEEDSNKNLKEQPIPGADDAGSGVGVLLEIARQLGSNPISDLGVDIILWDAEDQGQRGEQNTELTWCLGSQHWSRNKHRNKYQALYGINLDMVGAKNPRFAKEAVSKYYAPKVLDKVWKLAQTMGYSDMFVNDEIGGITDDHKVVNEIAQIPMIDIINLPLDSKHSFVNHWHTHGDDMSIISKRTLKVVGQTVLATVYKEADGSIKSFE